VCLTAWHIGIRTASDGVLALMATRRAGGHDGRVRATRAAVLAGTCFGLTVVAEVSAVVLSWGLRPAYDMILFAVYEMTLVGIGALVATRQPHHPVGWILAVGGMVFASGDLGPAWGLRAADGGWPGGPYGEWLGITVWAPSVLMFVLAFLLTPTGRPPGRRWWLVAWAGAVAVVLLVPGWSLDSARDPEFVAGRNPLVAPWLPHDGLVAVGSILLCSSLAAALASLVVRYRGADHIERQQLKWVVFAAMIMVAFFPPTIAWWSASPLVRGLAPISLTVIALALAAAVLRYRLFEVDLVINRTVVYAIVSLLLAATYGGTAVTLGSLFGGPNSWTVAGATLAAAMLFRPVRRVVQGMVDRRFDRDRYSARARVVGFLEGVRAGTDPPERIEDVLREVLKDPSIDLLLRLPASGAYADVRGRPTQPDPSRPSVSIHRHGRPDAVVQYDGAPDRLREAEIRDVLEAGLLAVEIARAHVELNRQLDEVERSRARIAGAADDERRRIQRDLHDGAQPRLVTVGISLRSLEARLRAEGRHEEADRLDGAVAELAATIEELRDLAQSLPPAQLDGGIGAAFAELAQRAPLRVAVDVRVERLDRAIEATAYFVGCEGLTNVIKHAAASAASLTAVRHNGSLVVSVADDGRGGAAARPGSGLAGLADRVEAAGGRLVVESSRAGTTLTAVLPCE
jgi:signal transduction histidine kinase